MGCVLNKPRIDPSAESSNNHNIHSPLHAIVDERAPPDTCSCLSDCHLTTNIPCQEMATERVSNAVAPAKFMPELVRTEAGHLVPQTIAPCDIADGFISTVELYNSMNDGQRMPYLHDPNYMLILDGREREAFNEWHITTARHVTAVDTDYDCLLEQGKLKKFLMTVVYDNSSSSKKFDPSLNSFVQRLKDADIDVQILNGGFHKFSNAYPFLCNNMTIRSEQDRMRLFKSYPSVVLDDILYQGNVKHSLDRVLLQNLNITHILNVSSECKNAFPEHFEYLRLAVEDETSAQLGPHFQTATKFIADAISGGGRVMVHCIEGKSRSSTCTIAFLMAYRGWTLTDSHHYLKDRRSIAAPNRAFLLQLSKYEETIFSKALSSVDELYF